MHGGESGGHGGDGGSAGASAASGSGGGRDQGYREDLRGWLPVFGISAAVIVVGLLVVLFIK
ncbi:hypothetical protein [Kitasatospora sp. NPDC093558]|uniref:hypothetical protein n=1 Tax=Kitasatospora sp. NPDC093558 TaxID=3155201 RepID=UPI00341F13CF